MKAPRVSDFNSLLPEMIRTADLQKLRSELINCLPSLPNMPDLLQLKNDLGTSLNSLDFSSLSGWRVAQLLTNCLPEHISSASKSRDINTMVIKMQHCHNAKAYF